MPPTVLITGANSGVGYHATKAIASAPEGYHVIMTGRSLEKVKSAMSEIQASGIKGSLSAVPLDVTDKESIERAVESVEKEHGRLDALINNAGVATIEPDTIHRFRYTFETNVLGAALVADAFRPLLLLKEAPPPSDSSPRSIFVSSAGGSLALTATPDPSYTPFPNEDAYRASKAALNMIAVVEMRDFGPKGLKVFAMCPGLVVSNLRGPSEEARTAGGKATDPSVSGETLLSIVQGKRDADVGKFVHKDGVYPW